MSEPLRDPVETTGEMTYDAPCILLDAKSTGGIVTHSVREGKAAQVPLLTRLEWTEAPVDEHAQVFTIKARNQVRFAGQTISVINDATEFGDKVLPATAPTASEYLSLVGQQVLIHFDYSRDIMETKRLGRPVFKVARNFVTLP